MNRRHLNRIFQGLALGQFFAPEAVSANPPWIARFIVGSFADDDGLVSQGQYTSGLHLLLQPNWKTYWRVPGSGGIAPDFKFEGDNLETAEVFLPTPSRLKVGDEEINGYTNEVTFLFALTPKNPDVPLAVSVNAFLGVCEDICIPVPLKAELSMSRNDIVSRDAVFLAVSAEASHPSKLDGNGMIEKATLNTKAMELELTFIADGIDDVFVECAPTTYVKRPIFSADRRSVRMPVSGNAVAADLLGANIRVTLIRFGSGLEQTVRVV
jgi:DsbC/DsbD-like thiol-disulfide interchange protein